MKHHIKTLISKSLVVLLVFFLLPVYSVNASDPGTTTPPEESYVVTGYSMSSSTIRKGNTVTATITVKHEGGTPTTAADLKNALLRRPDSFQGGTFDVDGKEPLYTIKISGLKYRGEGNKLIFRINSQEEELSISECKEYVEPTPEPIVPSTPVAKNPPRIVFEHSDIPSPISSGEVSTFKLKITNYGNGTDIHDAVLTIEPESEGVLIFKGGGPHYIKELKSDKSEEFVVSLKGASKIEGESQSLKASLTFDYYNNVSNETTTVESAIRLPSAITPEEEKPEEKKEIANPVPLIILTNFSYGGEAVAAGETVNLSFSFRNTSSIIPVENVMLSVTGGENLTINGASNTFYFDAIAKGDKRSVSIPFRVVPIITGKSQDVKLNFSYEYVDNEERKNNSTEMTISVPLYQPDKFVVSDPVTTYEGMVGEDTSLTLDYVNMGKSPVSNVEARIEGDIDSDSNLVRVGNVESGKNGTITFAIRPMNEGENNVKVTVQYEDANGEINEQVFETVVTAMGYEPVDPGEFEDPIEPIEEEKKFPVTTVAIIAAALVIIAAVVINKRKKKAKLLAEQALLEDWDEDFKE